MPGNFILGIGQAAIACCAGGYAFNEVAKTML